jgi:hypothetical protein
VEILEAKTVKIELNKEALKVLQDAGIDDLMLAARSEDGNYTIHVIADLKNLSAHADVRIRLP